MQPEVKAASATTGLVGNLQICGIPSRSIDKDGERQTTRGTFRASKWTARYIPPREIRDHEGALSMEIHRSVGAWIRPGLDTFRSMAPNWSSVGRRAGL